MYTTPENWFERFKAAGANGRVDAAKIWFSESGPLPQEAVDIVDELRGPENGHAYLQVLEHLQVVHRGFVGWADF